MKKIYRQSKPFILLLVLCGLIVAACGSTAESPSDLGLESLEYPSTTLPQTEVSASEAAPLRDDAEPVEVVMSVLTHPRCSNCHPNDSQPRQTDEQIVHILNVTSGGEGHDNTALGCETCHQQENNPYSLVPGAPHWDLAPRSMAWLGLTHAEIARTLIDPAKNGNRSFDDLVEHVREDALVLWGWEPGSGRTPIPVPHDQFVQALETWLDAGAPILGE